MKLTLLSKVFISLVILAAVGFIGYKNGWLTSFFAGPPQSPAPSGSPSASANPSQTPAAPTGPSGAPAAKKRIVVGVNDFGGAYAGLVANDGAIPGPNSLFAKEGLDVEIRLVRGSKERLADFDAGKIDVMLLTLDYVANLYADYKKKNVELATFMFVDWSRGNLGIVTKPGFNTVESLKKARIATTRNTPTHYFALTLLERSSLKPADIDQVKAGFVFAKKTPDAGEMFNRGEVDAVAIWEPHLTEAMTKGNGKLLVSTVTATNLVADVLFARRDFLTQNAEVMPAFIRAWLGGAERLKADPEGSITKIAAAFSQTPELTRAVLSKIKPANFADNRAFFGLETEGSPYERLLSDAAQIWKKEGLIEEAPPPKQVAMTKFLESLAPAYKDQKLEESFSFQNVPSAKVEPILTKSASIYFGSGSAELDANARKVVDEFSNEIVGIFQNSFIRVEGNTDSTGNKKANVELSKKRAEAVVDYLVTRQRFDRARFVAVGNGPDRPIGDNKTDEGREWNRRTDFRVVPNY
ncbi:MAG: OmpA family protein [Myxococcota bacterium]